MSPRASLPGADELFRNTAERQEEPEAVPQAPPVPISAPSMQIPKEISSQGPRHEEKVTFYCTPEDLTRLERARLTLRADHRLGSDRGKIVRAALAEMLDDFESRGANSALVRQLQQL